MRIPTHILHPRKHVLHSVVCLLLVLCATGITQAQPKRQPSRAKAPVTNPPPTFETLLASDTYKIYGEVRGVGQLIRSNSVNELLEPVMKLAAPPRELGTLVKWLNKHADELMTSRMLVAGWPTAKDVPTLLVAIEFASPDEAEKFEPQLNDFLPRVLPTPTPSPSPETAPDSATSEKQKPTPPTPSYYLSRSGALIFISPTKLTVKNLRPAGSKLLSEDHIFRTARDRFGSEQLFVFVDFNGIQKEEEEESAKRDAETNKKNESDTENAEASNAATTAASATASPAPAVPVESAEPTPVAVPELQSVQDSSAPDQKQSNQPDPMSLATGLLSTMFSSMPSKWPEGIGMAISLDNESLDAKVFMVSSPGEKSDAIPFLPFLIPGQAITPEGASILPSDTELLVTASLDWTQMYARFSKPDGPTIIAAKNDREEGSPFAELESKLGIKIKDDLLPLLGNEVAMSLQVVDSGSKTSTDSTKEKTPPKPKEPSPVIAISIRDKAATKALLPKVVDGMGFKGASGFAQVEKRGDTEIVSYADAFAYAYVGNFLVVSPDVANVRHVVESYLKGEVLSGDSNFKNYNRWQPRQLQGQVYLSPALMESYKSWAQEPTALISDQTREFLSRLVFTSQPVTYSLSNDGLGAMHELHLPKNLLLMLVASISGETNPPPMLANERAASAAVQMIAGAEAEYKTSKGNGSYATLEQLIADKDYLKSLAQNSNYKIEVTVAGNHFEVSATPAEYGKTGRMSYFMDETLILRGGDIAGAPATAASKPVIP